MPTPHESLSDDDLAELLADAWLRAASQPGAARLRALQAAGLLPESGLTQEQIGAGMGCSRALVWKLEQQAIRRLRYRLKPLIDR